MRDTVFSRLRHLRFVPNLLGCRSGGQVLFQMLCHFKFPQDIIPRRGDVDMLVKFSPIYQCDNKPIPNEPLFDFVSLSVE
jgi:hypothetical protein